MVRVRSYEPDEIKTFKQKAKELKQQSGIAYTKALEQVAKDAGFESWNHLTGAVKKTDSIYAMTRKVFNDRQKAKRIRR